MKKGEGEEGEGERGRRVMVHNCGSQTLANLEGVGFNNGLCGVWCVVCGMCVVCVVCGVCGVCVVCVVCVGGRGHNHSNVCTVNVMVVPSTHSWIIGIHVNLRDVMSEDV